MIVNQINMKICRVVEIFALSKFSDPGILIPVNRLDENFNRANIFAAWSSQKRIQKRMMI